MVESGAAGYAGIVGDPAAACNGIQSFSSRRTDLARKYPDFDSLYRHWKSCVDALLAEIIAGEAPNHAWNPKVLEYSGTHIALRRNEGEAWLADGQFVPIAIMGVTDPDGDSVTLTVTGVTQDEPVKGSGSRNTSPDAVIQAGAASVRAERSGTGNGRVYHLSFTADDGKGRSCTGAVTVGVPHSLPKGTTAIDDGQNFDSTIP